MVGRIGKMATGLLLVAAGTSAAHSESFGISLLLQVPVMCTVKAGAGAAGVATGPAAPGSFELGAIREYCNAPHGYDLVVHYTPGSLKGMTLIAGDERVQLDGSGTALVGRSPGPAIKYRNLEAIPGPQGFDADHLDFETVAAPF
jgi:hypothetical protein